MSKSSFPPGWSAVIGDAIIKAALTFGRLELVPCGLGPRTPEGCGGEEKREMEPEGPFLEITVLGREGGNSAFVRGFIGEQGP